VDFESWPPPRDRRYESYSEGQILHWIQTVGPVLDAQGNARLQNALENRRAGEDRLQQQKAGYVARKVKKTVRRVKRRRSADPPTPSNASLVGHGLFGGIGSGVSLGGVLVGLEIYEKVKETGIVWDALWILAMIGKVFAGIEWGFGDMIGLVVVVCIGVPIAIGWKLIK